MGASLPLVSVVIPTFNHGHFVCDAVRSVLVQAYPSLEVIVVDDGSKDDTRERLKPYMSRIRYVYQENRGLSAARNTGIHESKGEYIAFLDSDDMFHPNKLQRQMQYLLTHPEVSFIASDSIHGLLEPPWPELAGELSLANIALDQLVVRSRFGSCGVVVRKTCFADVGLFDESLRSVEDRDMWIRIASKYRVVLLKEPLYWYRCPPGSMSQNAKIMEQYERIVLDKAFAMTGLRARRVLYWKAFGVASASAAYMYYASGQNWSALKRILHSFVLWPLPYRLRDARKPLWRARLLVGICRSALLNHNSYGAA